MKKISKNLRVLLLVLPVMLFDASVFAMRPDKSVQLEREVQEIMRNIDNTTVENFTDYGMEHLEAIYAQVKQIYVQIMQSIQAGRDDGAIWEQLEKTEKAREKIEKAITSKKRPKPQVKQQVVKKVPVSKKDRPQVKQSWHMKDRITSFIDWAKEKGLLLQAPNGAYERVFKAAGVINHIYQIRMPSAASGTKTGKETMNMSICGPQSLLSNYQLMEHFMRSTSKDYEKNLNLFHNDAVVADIFNEFKKKKLPLNNINQEDFEGILNTKQVKHMEHLDDLKFGKNFYVIRGIYDLDKDAKIANILKKRGDFMLSFVFLSEGYYEQARQNKLGMGKASHWISMFVVRALGELYWFISDSAPIDEPRGHRLEGKAFDLIQFAICKMLGASGSILRKLKHYSLYMRGKEAFDNAGISEDMLKFL